MKKIGASVAGAAGSIALLTLLSRLVGFLRTWVQNGALGDTNVGEAYSTANTVPNVLFEVAAGGALAGAVIPLISGFLAKKMRKEMCATAASLLTWIVAVGVPVALLVMLAAGPVTRLLLAHDVPEAELALAASLLRMFAVQIPLYGVSVVFTGVLQAHQRFLLPVIAPMLSSATVIATFVIFSRLAQGNLNHPEELTRASVMWLGWGTTFGVVVFSLSQLVPVMRLVKLRPTFRFPPGVAKRALFLAGAGMGGLVAQQVQIVTIMMVANARGGTGAYPVFTYANAVYMVPYAVLAVPIATAVFPRLSEAAALEGRPGLVELTSHSTRLVLDAGIMCSVMLAVLSRPANFVFDLLRPADSLDVALLAMAPGLVGYALIYHGSRVLYSVEAASSAAVVNAVAWLTVCLVLVIFLPFGCQGRSSTFVAIGVAMSVGMSAGAVGQLRALRKHIGVQATQGIGRSVVSVGAGMVVVGLLAYGVQSLVVKMIGVGLVGVFFAAFLSCCIMFAGGFAVIRKVDPQALKLAGR